MKDWVSIPMCPYALLRDALVGAEEHKHIFIDGYPRKVDQVDLLADTLGQPPSLVLVLHVPTVITVTRLLGRLTCGECGRVYGPASPPRAARVCDACDADLEHREDDNSEGIRRRHRFWRKYGAAIARHYERMGLVAHVDATQAPGDVLDLALAHMKRS